MYNLLELHTVAELKSISNINHWIIGYIFFLTGMVALIQLFGILKNKPYIWPLLVTLAGIILIPYNLLHHGFNELPLVWKMVRFDPQQQQHFIMFNLVFIGGVFEYLLSLKKLTNKYFRLFWPTALITIGCMFITHPQHGTAEALAYTALFHFWLGVMIITTGILRLLQVLVFQKSKQAHIAWLLFLMISAVMLISYSEPEGAYEKNNQETYMPFLMKH